MRGQVWSLDLALSLLLFSVALVVAYTVITNTIVDRGFEEVRSQAIDAGGILASEGYPVHWNSDDMLRLGLVSDGVMSLRKIDEIGGLTDDQVRQGLRVTNKVFVYVTNSSGDRISLFGQCGIGETVAVGGPYPHHWPAMALAESNTLTQELNNISVYTTSEALTKFPLNDVIILEGNVSMPLGVLRNDLPLELEDVAARGVTIVIIGDPGIPVLGFDFNTSTTNSIWVENNDGEDLELEPSEVLTPLGAPADVTTLIPQTNPLVSQYDMIAQSDENLSVYATWLYDDARVWFFGAVEGTREDSSDLLQHMKNQTQDMITKNWRVCSDATPWEEGKHVAHQQRAMAHHDDTLMVNAVVWRTT